MYSKLQLVKYQDYLLNALYPWKMDRAVRVSALIEANKSKLSDVLRLCETCQGSLGLGGSPSGVGTGTSSYSITGAGRRPPAGLGSWAGVGVHAGAGWGHPGPDMTNPNTNNLESSRIFQ